MNSSPHRLVLGATCGLALLLSLGCGGKKEAHDHDHDHAGHAHHVHVAPHGGALVELGEHQFNLEIVVDAATGKLSLYVLDAHAENFVRVNQPALTLTATAGGETRTLTLAPVASTASGETVTDTSAFESQAEWLKTTPSFDAVLAKLEVRGTTFEKVAFNFPKGVQD